MIKYISYKIETLENIKMGGQGSQFDNEYSLSYIAGSTVRGAYISKYISSLQVNDIAEEQTHRELLLGRKMKFLNAYPLVENKRSIPFPKCYFANKNEIKSFDGNQEIKLVNEFEKAIDGELDGVRVAEFCIIQNKGYRLANTEKIFNLHIAKNSEKNNIYRYEAIKKGQGFGGLIVFNGTSEEMEQCIALVKEQIFYLGGSKGSGYGKCRIYDVEVREDNLELEHFDSLEKGNFKNELYVFALSDMIARNSFGQIISLIEEDYLKDKLSLEEVSLMTSSMQTQTIGGYNNKWKARLPQIIGIKAGSIFKYQFKGDLSIEKVKALMHEGIGDRTEEGYGRIAVLNRLEGEKIEKKYKIEKKSRSEISLNQDEKLQLGILLTNIYKGLIEKELSAKVLKLHEGFKNHLPRTQLGKLLQVIMNMKSKTPIEGKELLRRYITHLSDKKNNLSVFYKYEDSTIQGVRLITYLKDSIENLDNSQEFFKNFMSDSGRKKVEIFQVLPKLDSEYVYQMNIKLWETLFRFALRNDKREGGEQAWG